eukprot:3863228-Pleurochrysis_carterae.AAC.2
MPGELARGRQVKRHEVKLALHHHYEELQEAALSYAAILLAGQPKPLSILAPRLQPTRTRDEGLR